MSGEARPNWLERPRQGTSPALQIRFAGRDPAGPFRTAYLACQWKRDDPEITRGPVMSASSGPKDYLKNDIIGVFQANETCERVALLVLNGVMFCIARMGPIHWYDYKTGEPVEVRVSTGVSRAVEENAR